MMTNNEKIDLLLKRYHSLSDEIAALDIAQSSFKVGINAFYGVLGLAHFKYYDYRLAEAVTSTGQVFIKKTMQVTNEILNAILKTQDDYVLASDTDSVVGDSLVYVNGHQMTIASLYDSIGMFTERNDAIKSYVKPVTQLKTLSFNTTTETVEERPIKYVMKHRVKKRMYRITVGDKSVTVTEDHSIIVQRNNQYISVKPSELTRTDVLVNITTQQGVSLYGTDKSRSSTNKVSTDIKD